MNAHDYQTYLVRME